MKKSILQGFAYVICLTIAVSCAKTVKSPSQKTTVLYKTTSTTAVTTASTAGSGHTCGSQSSSSTGSGY
jgi:hypothetical protein